MTYARFSKYLSKSFRGTITFLGVYSPCFSGSSCFLSTLMIFFTTEGMVVLGEEEPWRLSSFSFSELF